MEQQASGSGIRALRRLAVSQSVKVQTKAQSESLARFPQAPPPSLSLASDREGLGISTSSALGVDAEGELLKIFGGGGKSVPLGGADDGEEGPPPSLELVQAAEEGDFERLVTLLTDGQRDGLISRGCVNSRLGGAQRSALHYAAKAGAMRAVVALLGAGADPKATCAPPTRLTPLHAVADAPFGSPTVEATLAGIARMLCTNGGDANARDGEFEQTPLHFAALKGHEGVAKVLVECGADVGAVDRFGDNPYDLAVDAGFSQLAEFFSIKQCQ